MSKAQFEQNYFNANFDWHYEKFNVFVTFVQSEKTICSKDAEETMGICELFSAIYAKAIVKNYCCFILINIQIY
jgi:hypothetical protein